jgi:dienelactone hydrolase
MNRDHPTTIVAAQSPEVRRSGPSRREVLAALLASCSFSSLLRAAATDAGVAWLDEVQRPPAKLPSDGPRLGPLLVDDQGNKITTLEQWERRRKTIRRWWLDFMGTLDVKRQRVPALTVIEEDRRDGVVRQRVSYEIEPGEITEAYLLKPAHSEGRRPGAVVFHSTVECSILQPAGMRPSEERRYKAFGLGLARRGYVAFCPRNFLWPDNTTLEKHQQTARFQRRHPGAKGMAKMLFDGIAALDILANLPNVDPARLGAVGHSLGAKEALYLAAFDDRVRAAVSSEGGIGTRFSNWAFPWYFGKEIRSSSFTHEHHELLALVAPRAFLLLAGETGPGAADGARSWPFVQAALPVYELYGGKPRIGLFNHGQGHSVPPEAEKRLYEWLDAYC